MENFLFEDAGFWKRYRSGFAAAQVHGLPDVFTVYDYESIEY